MSRAGLAAAGLAAVLALGGCQTWQDRADAKSVAECSGIADAADRKACQNRVMAEAQAAEDRVSERQQELETAQEERDRLREVYGKPK